MSNSFRSVATGTCLRHQTVEVNGTCLESGLSFIMEEGRLIRYATGGNRVWVQVCNKFHLFPLSAVKETGVILD